MFNTKKLIQIETYILVLIIKVHFGKKYKNKYY